MKSERLDLDRTPSEEDDCIQIRWPHNQPLLSNGNTSTTSSSITPPPTNKRTIRTNPRVRFFFYFNSLLLLRALQQALRAALLFLIEVYIIFFRLHHLICKLVRFWEKAIQKARFASVNLQIVSFALIYMFVLRNLRAASFAVRAPKYARFWIAQSIERCSVASALATRSVLRCTRKNASTKRSLACNHKLARALCGGGSIFCIWWRRRTAIRVILSSIRAFCAATHPADSLIIVDIWN